MKDRMTAEEFRAFKAKNAIKSSNPANANQLTNDIIRYLNLHEGFAWRNNTGVIFDVRAAAKRLVEFIKTCVLTKRLPNFREVERELRKGYRKGSGHAGESDIYFIQKRTKLFYAIEVKFGKDKLSIEQRVFLDDIRRSGGIPVVASSLEDVISAINIS